MEISGGMPLSYNQQQIRPDSAAAKPNQSEAAPQASLALPAALSIDASVDIKNLEAALKMLSGDKMSEALAFAGFKVTPENLLLAEALVTSGVPVLAETLHKMNQAFKLTNLNIGEAKFLMLSELKPNAKNAALVGKFARGENRILNELSALTREISAMPESAEKAALVGILLNDGVESGLTTGEWAVPDDGIMLDTLKNNHGIATQNVGDSDAAEAARPLGHDGGRITAPADSDSEGTIRRIAEDIAFKSSETGETDESGKPIPGQVAKDSYEAPETPIIREKPSAKANEESPGMRPQFEAVRREKDDTPLFERLVKRFAIDASLGDKQTDEIDKKLNSLLETVSELKAEISKQNEASKNQWQNPLTDSAEKLAENIRFQNEIKNAVYVQIPMLVNNRETNAELYIFKDKKSKNTSSSAKSALISLDLLSLGHLEAYIHKNGRLVSCQFRVQSEDVRRLIEEHTAKFNELLENNGFKLELIMFKQIDDIFTILDREPALNEIAQGSKYEPGSLGVFDKKA